MHDPQSCKVRVVEYLIRCILPVSLVESYSGEVRLLSQPHDNIQTASIDTRHQLDLVVSFQIECLCDRQLINPQVVDIARIVPEAKEEVKQILSNPHPFPFQQDVSRWKDVAPYV